MLTHDQIDTLSDDEAVASVLLLDGTSFEFVNDRDGWLTPGGDWTPFEIDLRFERITSFGWKPGVSSFDSQGNAARAYLKWLTLKGTRE